MREVINTILCVLRSGCPWRLLPEPSGPRSDSFPPMGTVWHWFRRLRDAGTFAQLGYRLTMMDRERCGREASPSAAIMDGQTGERQLT